MSDTTSLSSGKHSPFKRRSTPAKRRQSIAFWLFRVVTYLILLFVTYIFADIVWNGSRMVFTTQAPFINVKFFTEPPQTLYVFDYYTVRVDGQSRDVDAAELNRLVRGQNREISNIDYHAGKFTYMRNYVEQPAQSAAIFSQQLRDLGVSLELLTYEEYELSAKEFDVWRQQRGIPLSETLGARTYAYSGGGILPNIVGTGLLTIGAVLIALVLGTLVAIYLSEYSKPGRLLNLVRLSILNLAGVPSVVFGIFGFGAFVLFFGWNTSLLAGCFTLAFMVLPVIIASCEESMKSIPQGFREGSLALGASKWTTIRTNVIPYALPGIMTSSILGITRVAGETAPIMFTAAYASTNGMPWDNGFWQMFMEPVMALPYHIYVVSLKIPQNEYTEKMQYGTSLVFILLVGAIAAASIYMRAKARKKYRW